MAIDLHDERPMRFDLQNVGVPTTYRGIEYRSRLEARWAAMFDSLKWPHKYEPLDLSGYVPDALIAFPRANLLIEIKPAIRFDELREATRKITLSGWRGDFLIVGATLLEPKGDWSSRAFGLLGLWDHESNDGWQPADYAIAVDCVPCGRTTLMHASAEWFCLACGANTPRRDLERTDVEALDQKWNEAGNSVKWRKGPRP